MYTKKDVKKIEDLARKHSIELYAVCKKCGTHWCTLDEHELIAECEKCKTGDFIEHFADIDDTFEAIERLKNLKNKRIRKEKI